LEEIKLLQRVRRRTAGTSTAALGQAHGEGDAEDDDDPTGPSELLDTFSKAKAVTTTEEDPNM
jgi:hypothetical protein